MIRVRITSRLGNQLFQYAFAYAAAKKLNTDFAIEYKSKHGNIIGNYFDLNAHVLSDEVPADIIRQNGHHTPADFMKSLSDDTLYIGYFQSLDYFSSREQEIRSLFTIKEYYTGAFQEKYHSRLTSAKNVVVHLRRSDYSDYDKVFLGGKDICLPDHYISRCLAQIPDIHLYNLFFISDDIAYAKAAFSERFPHALFEHNHELIDFQLLIHADILVISNSTFAWWGAWLNPNADKLIYTPEYWLGFKVENEYPVGIIPASWIKVSAT